MNQWKGIIRRTQSMLTGMARFFSTQGFMPHGMCLLWTPSVLWTLVVSNAMIFVSYMAIPLALVYVYWKRQEFQYIWIFLLFGAFIILCGFTHLDTIITYWYPIYGIAAVTDLATGIVSVLTAIILWRLVPSLMRIPTMKGLEEQNKALEQTLKDLKRSNEELDEFTYIASHDMKEPLRGISHFASILLEDYENELDNDAQYELRTIKKLSVQMTHLIDGLHKYSRVTRNEGKTELVNLKTILENKIELLTDYLNRRNASVQTITEIPRINCNPVFIGEIFYNLILNGIKYNESETPKVQIIYYDKKDKHLFCVADNGIGIKEEDLKKVFHIFRRVDKTNKYGEGSGIGLNIVEKIVKRAGGEVWIESKENEGTKVYFTIIKE